MSFSEDALKDLLSVKNAVVENWDDILQTSQQIDKLITDGLDWLENDTNLKQVEDILTQSISSITSELDDLDPASLTKAFSDAESTIASYLDPILKNIESIAEDAVPESLVKPIIDNLKSIPGLDDIPDLDLSTLESKIENLSSILDLDVAVKDTTGATSVKKPSGSVPTSSSGSSTNDLAGALLTGLDNHFQSFIDQNESRIESLFTPIKSLFTQTLIDSLDTDLESVIKNFTSGQKAITTANILQSIQSVVLTQASTAKLVISTFLTQNKGSFSGLKDILSDLLTGNIDEGSELAELYQELTGTQQTPDVSSVLALSITVPNILLNGKDWKDDVSSFQGVSDAVNSTLAENLLGLIHTISSSLVTLKGTVPFALSGMIKLLELGLLANEVSSLYYMSEDEIEELGNAGKDFATEVYGCKVLFNGVLPFLKVTLDAYCYFKNRLFTFSEDDGVTKVLISGLAEFLGCAGSIVWCGFAINAYAKEQTDVVYDPRYRAVYLFEPISIGISAFGAFYENVKRYKLHFAIVEEIANLDVYNYDFYDLKVTPGSNNYTSEKQSFEWAEKSNAVLNLTYVAPIQLATLIAYALINADPYVDRKVILSQGVGFNVKASIVIEESGEAKGKYCDLNSDNQIITWTQGGKNLKTVSGSKDEVQITNSAPLSFSSKYDSIGYRDVLESSISFTQITGVSYENKVITITCSSNITVSSQHPITESAFDLKTVQGGIVRTAVFEVETGKVSNNEITLNLSEPLNSGTYQINFTSTVGTGENKVVNFKGANGFLIPPMPSVESGSPKNQFTVS